MIKNVKGKVVQNQNFIKHLSSTYLIMLVNYAALFFLTPYTWKQLNTEEFGIWVLLTTIITYFGLSNMGFLQSLLTELPKRRDNPQELNKLVSTVFYSLLGFSALGLVVAFVIYWGMEHFFKISPENVRVAKLAFWPAYGTFLLSFISSVFYNIMLSSSKIVEKNFLELLKIIFSNLLIFLMVKMGYGLIGIVWATFGVTLVYVIALYVQAKKILDFRLSHHYYDKITFREMAKPSLYYFLIGIGYQIVFYSDNLLIGKLAGTAFVAVYAQTYRIPDIALKFIMKISDMKLPKITTLNSQHKYSELLQIHNRLLVFTAGVALPAFLFLYFLGIKVLEIWLQDDTGRFDPMIMRIFAFYMLIHAILHVPSAFLTGMGVHKRVSYFSLIEAGLNIVLSLIFYQWIGLAGIALGTLTASLPSLVFVLYEFYGYIYRSEKFTSWRQLWRV